MPSVRRRDDHAGPRRLLTADVGGSASEGAGGDEHGAMPIGPGRLGAEREVLGRLKSLTLGLFGAARRAYGDGVRDQQEVLARLANLVIDVYAIESAIGRAEKQLVAHSERPPVMVVMVEVFLADAVTRMTAAVTTIAVALGPACDAAWRTLLSSIHTADTTDTIARRRLIAAAVVAAGGSLH